MSIASEPLLDFDDSYVRELEGLSLPWQAARFPEPRLIVLNEALAAELGADPQALRTPDGVALLTGQAGSTPVAQAYAGHQFGMYVPRLGDGRALLLGEVVDSTGTRRDVHLKGSGRTPFARGGDGKAPLGPMLREYLVSEAMHALGIPTTRSLSVVATGEEVYRRGPEPGAVLARVAASHIRVGTFEYAAAAGGPELVTRLADYAIARHHPDVAEADNPYLALFERVLDLQADLIARWLAVGFIHGVMNTDNMTISGETIDYGPCAFMDGFDPRTVFSSIDAMGRYAYGNQPAIGQWNLARLGETLLPLIDEVPERAAEVANAVLHSWPDRHGAAWRRRVHAKLGLPDGPGEDEALVDDLFALLQAQTVDFTSFFRALGAAARGDAAPAQALFAESAAFAAWLYRWQGLLADGPSAAEAMDRVNPVYIPRNHLVEEALAAGVRGDLQPFEALLGVLARPYDARPGLEAYEKPASTDFSGGYQTFCGT